MFVVSWWYSSCTHADQGKRQLVWLLGGGSSGNGPDRGACGPGAAGWGGAGSSGSDGERGARRSQASWGPALHDVPGDKRAPPARVRGRRYIGPTSKAMSASFESRAVRCTSRIPGPSSYAAMR